MDLSDMDLVLLDWAYGPGDGARDSLEVELVLV